MKNPVIITNKLFNHNALSQWLTRWRLINKTIAFTNGCFDILHVGHLASLLKAAQEADLLVVGLNSDLSTKRLKGDTRPINNQHDRALLLAALVVVDAVIIFEEDTPLELIKLVQPDVLIKGGDYTLEQIVGANEVLAAGGRVVINSIEEGHSTTGVLNKIAQL